MNRITAIVNKMRAYFDNIVDEDENPFNFKYHMLNYFRMSENWLNQFGDCGMLT